MSPASFLAIFFTGLLFVARCWGRTIKLRRVCWFAGYDFFYASKSCTISIDKIFIRFHLPRPQAPHWATITGERYEYEDGSSHVSLDRCRVKFLFFPVHFRFSAGPWIEMTMDGFVVDVRSSEDVPWWINALRNNLVTTILDGETILLHSIKTKLYFGTATKLAEDHNDGSGEAGVHMCDVKDDLRVQYSSSQWNIVTPCGRMYSFGTLNAELRRSWVEDRGTLAITAENCRWLKLRNTSVEKDHSIPWMILSVIWSLPRNAYRFCFAPLSFIDVYVPNCQVSFKDFHLRDTELLQEGAVKLKGKYDNFDHHYPGGLANIAWDAFAAGTSSCQ